MYIDEDTFVVQLTVGQLISLLKKEFPALTATPKNADADTLADGDGPTFTGRLVYGLRGIRSLFNVAHKTAWQWKETWLKPAVIQNGRKIITDADYALKLFDEKMRKAEADKKG